jgi:hypothetical protein
MRGRSTLLAVLALCLAPAGVSAAPQDLAATHAYIQADYARARAGVARLGAAHANIARLNSNLARECPLIGAGSLQDEASQTVTAEVVAALWSVAFGTDAGPIRSFAATVGRLRWSNPTITRIAKRYARGLHELATLRLPNLCEDVRTWKASGFQVLPAATVSLVQRVDAIEPTAVPPALLAPYERGADAGLLARATQLQLSIEEDEFTIGLNQLFKVLGTLGLNE